MTNLLPFDLAFIGAGASTSYTLVNLCDRLDTGGEPLRVAVIERSATPYAGLPYDYRSTYSSLLITSVRDFLPDPERGLFCDWLTVNRGWALSALVESGGRQAQRWIDDHRAQIEAGEWLDLYVPRYLFGLYLRERVDAKVMASARIDVTVLRGEVERCEKSDGGYTVSLRDQAETLMSRRVVLAVGSPANRRLFGSLADDDRRCVIEDPYLPGLDVTLERAGVALRQAGPHGARVVLIGANATTLDVLYALRDRYDDLIDEVHVIAPSGKLPDRWSAPAANEIFLPSELHDLTGATGVTAKQIFDAACAAVARGERAGLTASDTLAPISAAVGALVARLPADEMHDFACRWGIELGRRQRRAGAEYSDAASSLEESARLTIHDGEFASASAGSNGASVVEYSRQGQPVILAPAAVVINCAGFAKLDDLPDNPLLAQLLAQGVCVMNGSRGGIAVSDDLEAAPNLYVLGPLLAGNVIRGRPVWHMEHCGRVRAYAADLADVLAERVLSSSVSRSPVAGAVD